MDVTEPRGDWDEQVEIKFDEPEETKAEESEVGSFVAPTQGTELALTKVRNSLVSGLHCVVGEFEAALRLLQKQIALVNPEPLKSVMQFAFLSARPRFTALPNSFAAEVQLVNSAKLPVIPIQFELLSAIHAVALRTTVERKSAHDGRRLFAGADAFQELHSDDSTGPRCHQGTGTGAEAARQVVRRVHRGHGVPNTTSAAASGGMLK